MPFGLLVHANRIGYLIGLFRPTHMYFHPLASRLGRFSLRCRGGFTTVCGRAEEELQLLLDSSADDFDFLVPTILDGSSTGLEGAVGGLPLLTTIKEPRSRLSGSCTLEVKYC